MIAAFFATAFLGCSVEGDRDWRSSDALEDSASELSHVGLYVQRLLEDYQDDEDFPISSGLTVHNRFDPGWFIATPDISKTLWGHPAPANDPGTKIYFERVADEIAKAEHTVEISTLYLDLDILRRYFAPAIRKLHEKNLNPPPVVRFMFSTKSEIMPRHVFPTLAAELPADQSQWNVAISTVKLGNPEFFGLLDWNHSKIVIRDQWNAIVGGQNLLSSYETETNPPRYDASLAVSGQAAGAALHFFDRLWERSNLLDREDQIPVGEMPSKDVCSSNYLDGDCHSSPPVNWDALREAYLQLPNDLPIFALGRGIFSPYPRERDLSADRVLINVYRTAWKRIYIHQETMRNLEVGGEHDAVKIYDRLAERLLEVPELEVRMTLAAYEDESGISVAQNDRAYDEYCDMVRYLRGKYRRKAGFESMLDRLNVAPFSPAGDGIHANNHYKLVMVDDAFYVGSQNLYPGSTRSDSTLISSFITTAEFGFLVDAAWAAEQARQAIFEPIWAASSPYRYDHRGCADPPPPWDVGD